MQSTHKAVRACKSFRLHHRCIISALEIPANSMQTLPQNNSCTNANYILERSWGNGKPINANPPFVQSTHKAVQACKYFRLQHRRIIRHWKFAQIPCKPYTRTIVALMQTTYELEAVGMWSPKTQTLLLCNQCTKRYELANRSPSTIAVLYRHWKFAQIPGKTYPRTIVALMQTPYEQEAVGMGSPKTQTLGLCNQCTKRYELAVRSASTISELYRQWIFAQIPGKTYPRTIVALMQTTNEQEAVGMGSPKTQTLGLCNQRTKRYELANPSASTIAVFYRQWKFAQIPCKPYTRTIVALMQTT